MSSKVIVIQGGPATGKTTLTDRLRHDLELGALRKDDIKEFLFDSFAPTRDRDESRIYGVATVSALFSIAKVFIKYDMDFIIESAFHAELANKDLKLIASEADVSFVQVHCLSRSEVQVERYNARIASGHRHSGHHDSPINDIEAFDKSLQVFRPLEIDATIEYDTSEDSEAEYNRILHYLRNFIGANHATTN